MEYIITVIISFITGGGISSYVSWVISKNQIKNEQRFIVINKIKSQIKSNIDSFHEILEEYTNITNQLTFDLLKENYGSINNEIYVKVIGLHNKLRVLINDLSGDYELMKLIFKDHTKWEIEFSKILVCFIKLRDYQSNVEHKVIAEIVTRLLFEKEIEKEVRYNLSDKLMSIHNDNEEISIIFKEIMSFSGVDIIEFLNKNIAKQIV